MMATENKNNNVIANNTNTNEAAAQQEQQMQLVNNNLPEQAQQPEKKKFDVKGTLKKVGFGIAGLAAVAGAAFGGYELGKHSASKDSNQTAPAPTDGGNNESAF